MGTTGTDSPGTGSPAPPAAEGIGRDLQAALNLVMARAAAVLAPLAAAAVGVVALRASDPVLASIAVVCGLVGVVALWQLMVGRPRALVLNLMTGVGLGAVTPLVTGEVAVGIGTGVVVLVMGGIPLLPVRRVYLYAVGVSLLWLVPFGAVHIRQDMSSGVLVAFLIQSVFLAFGVTYLLHMRRQLERSEGRYAYLFRHAPIALWENDFSRAEEWLGGLRRAGVDDLARHFDEHPEVLRHGIGLVSTTAVNRAAVRLLAADSACQLVGPFPVEVLDAESEDLFRRQFLSMWELTEGEEMEYSGLRFDGSRFQGVLRWFNPLLEGGDPGRVVTAVSDISDLREIEEELKRSETQSSALLDALPDILLLMSADGTLLDFRATGAASSGIGPAGGDQPYVPRDSFLGKRPGEALPAHVAESISKGVAMALETGTVQAFQYEAAVGGRARHWEMRVAPLEGRSEVMALVREITDQVEARRELESLVRSKDDFIAAISHEIRTPLTGILGFSHLLRGDAGDMAPAERKQMIETLVDQAGDLSNIVEDLLVAAKADLGRLEVAAVPTNLRAQAFQVLESSLEGIAEVPVIGPDVSCIGDPARVRQIIRNLLTNAQRYGGDGVRVEVGPGPGMGRLVVADDGPGIPDDELEAAFEPYGRVGGGSRHTGSLGLGLAISRDLARTMGGDLKYARIEGETRFELSLPLASDRTTPAAKEGAVESA